MATREEWDRRFLQTARLVSQSSKDPSTKVGAVISDYNNRLISAGYNGFPRGVFDDPERLADRDIRLKMTMHAEKNAILFAQRDLSNCTLYSTFIPCASCAAMIIQSGITRVVTFDPPEDFAKRWADDIRIARMMMAEAVVMLNFYRGEMP